MTDSKTSPRDMPKNDPAKTMNSRFSRRDRGPFLTDFIEMPPGWHRKGATPAKVKWYVDRGWTIKKIAKELDVAEERVERLFARASDAPQPNPKPAYTKENIPYGWRIHGTSFEPDNLEQWVLEKITKERDAGKKLDDIANDLTRLGIKPKGGDLWFGRRVLKTIKENEALLIEYRARM